MIDSKAQQSLHNLGNAIARLREALEAPETDSLAIDGTIQRFEFVIELYWKTFKRLLAYEGIQTKTPREALQEAYQAEWIDDETAWLEMLRDRNRTSHIYDEGMAREIYTHVRDNFPVLEGTLHFLKARYESSGENKNDTERDV